MKPELMHGRDWSGENLAGWWASEKLDGWRCLWTGSEFVSREGKSLNAPDWFKTGMPSTALDGELWAGVKSTHNDVNAAVCSGDWSGLSFRPFDVPSAGLTVECAMASLSSLPLPPHARPVNFFKVQSTEAALSQMRSTAAAGGEGLMLRKSGSAYRPGKRTGDLLKLKPSGPAFQWFQVFPL